MEESALFATLDSPETPAFPDAPNRLTRWGLNPKGRKGTHVSTKGASFRLMKKPWPCDFSGGTWKGMDGRIVASSDTHVVRPRLRKNRSVHHHLPIYSLAFFIVVSVAAHSFPHPAGCSHGTVAQLPIKGSQSSTVYIRSKAGKVLRYISDQLPNGGTRPTVHIIRSKAVKTSCRRDRGRSEGEI